MRIVELAPWEEPVPPRKYGGTELVVHTVTEGLVKKGHEVFLIAAGTSTTSATLVPLAEKSFRELYPTEEYSPEQINELRTYLRLAKTAEAIKLINEIKPDIVHNHMSWRYVLFSHSFGCPMMTTIHGPLTAFQEQQTFTHYPKGNYVSISNNQRKALPSINWVETVYNGVIVEEFEEGDGRGDYFAFLGRISPEKGIKELCQVIKSTSHRLKIAAKIDAVDMPFFEQEIKPLIDGIQIEFIGEVDHHGKKELLKHAKALLLWLNWEEPFGLVVPEANACGTPVIVNARGAMPELIVDSINGFLVYSLDEMKIRLDMIGSINRHTCRQHVVDHFSAEKMVEGYEAVAKKIIAQNSI